jgi:hypothetical protein
MRGDDGLGPRGGGPGEGFELIEADRFEVLDMLEQLAGMEEAFSFSLGLEVEQVADLTHFAVQRLQ